MHATNIPYMHGTSIPYMCATNIPYMHATSIKMNVIFNTQQHVSMASEKQLHRKL